MGGDPGVVDSPTYRATIRNGLVTLNPWGPGLLGEGPGAAGFLTVTAALADLEIDEDELIVEPVPRAPWGPEAEEALLRWAPTVGYTRVWLPSRVVDFEAPAPLGRAIVDCPSCGAQWEDGSTHFWARVRGNGWFPARCPACGGSLPQWTTVSDAVPAERPYSRG